MSRNVILVMLLVVVGLVSISVTFYQTVIKQDFEAVNIEPIEEE